MENMDTMGATGPMAADGEYTDIHTHILPGIDDGASDLSVSEQMLKSLKGQGVGQVVLTPHFISNRESPEDFLRRRKTAYEKLYPAAKQLGVRIKPACELHFSDYVFNCKDFSPLCISGRYLLTEMPWSCDFSQLTFDRISRLISDENVIPILAHIERYDRLVHDRDCLERLIDLGCLVQINLDTLADSKFRLRKILLNYLRDGLVHVVGTDCHNMDTRPPRYLDGIHVIEQKIGFQCVQRIVQNSNGIFNYPRIEK